MKVVILAGGLGTRLSEETHLKPKPMIEIGGKPIIWHIMKYYSCFNLNDFIICCGYKGELIKNYFVNFSYNSSDFELELKSGKIKTINSKKDNWNIKFIDTGEKTQTGGRLLRIKKFLEKEKNFCLTYGDGLSNVNISDLINFHKKNKTIATVTAVQPLARFGALNISKSNKVTKFIEKPTGEGSLINGGFFVLQPKIFDYIADDSTLWEKEPLENLSLNNQLSAYIHKDFWHPMDTLRDKNYLEELWLTGKAKWKIW